MATIVVHGTMTHRKSTSYSWWWNSWGRGGFLGALAETIGQCEGEHDVWRVGGRDVAEWPSLRARGIPSHHGRVYWSGADTWQDREAGAKFLVEYLNRIEQVAPNEPLRLVAHSHGCNVVKLASAHKRLSPTLHFARTVFLACPHFAAGTQTQNPTLHYPLDPRRFGRILNLYSRSDSVQVKVAAKLPSILPGWRLKHFAPPEAFRVDPDPGARRVYEDYEVRTQDREVAAHSALHGAAVGGLIGFWLATNRRTAELVKGLGLKGSSITAGDHGA